MHMNINTNLQDLHHHHHHHHVVLLTHISLHSLSIRPSHLSLQAVLPDYIMCQYRFVKDKFSFVRQHWHINVKGSTGERHL